MPKLDTHRHFSYELLTAFLGDLLAVPQVNMTDISTAFEEGQALVSDLIAVCRKEKKPCEGQKTQSPRPYKLKGPVTDTENRSLA